MFLRLHLFDFLLQSSILVIGIEGIKLILLFELLTGEKAFLSIFMLIEGL